MYRQFMEVREDTLNVQWIVKNNTAKPFVNRPGKCLTHPYHKNTRFNTPSPGQELEQMIYNSRKGTPEEKKQIADLCNYHGKVLRLSGIEVERLKMVGIAPFACIHICMGTQSYNHDSRVIT
jgi:hypothetical protein